MATSPEILNSKPRSRLRKVRSPNFWKLKVQKFETSSLSVKEFCDRESVALSTFSRWLRTLRKSDRQESFIPLEVVPPEDSEKTPKASESSSPPVDSRCFKLFIKGALFLEIKEDFSPTTLRKIVSALSGGIHGSIS